MNNFRLLVTKKISASLVLQAGLKGVDVLEKEFVRIVSLTNDQLTKKINKLIAGEPAVAFTSKNAVASVAMHHTVADARWKIFCMEGATKNEVIRYFPASVIAGTAKNAAALANEIIQKSEEHGIIFFCGTRRLEDLPRLLTQRNIEVEEIVVYRTDLVPQKIVDDYDSIAFFSPSAVESFFLENTLKENVVCFSVGQTTTQAIKKYTNQQVITSERSSEDSVVELAIKHSKH